MSTSTATTPTSDEAPTRERDRRHWPEVDDDGPGEAAWRARAEAELEELRRVCDETNALVRKIVDRPSAWTKIALAVVACVQAVSLSPNLRWVALTLLGLAALVYGGTVAWGDLSIGAPARTAPFTDSPQE
jgi:hypothetical protein